MLVSVMHCIPRATKGSADRLAFCAAANPAAADAAAAVPAAPAAAHSQAAELPADATAPGHANRAPQHAVWALHEGDSTAADAPPADAAAATGISLLMLLQCTRAV